MRRAVKKIWKYNKKVYDVAGVVFDDKSYATREWEWPTPSGWRSVSLVKTDPLNLKFNVEDVTAFYMMTDNNKYNTVESALSKNLTYLSRFDCSDITYPFEYIEESYGNKGDLYLRCDEGNPGKVYKKISVIAVQESEGGWLWDRLIDGYRTDGCVLDNLHLTGFACDAYNADIDRENTVIQNCEVSWGGNRLFRFDSETPYQNGPIIGDGIYGVAHNAIIRNNYMHQMNEGCTFEESYGHGFLGTYKVYGNLMENCSQGVRIGLWEDPSAGSFSKVEIYDNIITDTGDTMNNGCMEQKDAIELSSDQDKWADDIDIHDNILLGSTQAMFKLPSMDLWQANIHDNVIAQDKSGYLICEMTGNWIESRQLSVPTWYMMVDAK